MSVQAVVQSPTPGWVRVVFKGLGLLTAHPFFGLLTELNEVPGVRVSETDTPGDIFVDAPRTVFGAPIWREFADRLCGDFNIPNYGLLYAPTIVRTGGSNTEALRLSRALYPHQEEAVDFLVRRKGGLLADDMGLGKGLRADEPVLTPDRGWVPIASLNVGDAVSDPAGGVARVLEVHRRGLLPLFRVSFSDGTGVITDADHKWHVQSPNHRTRGTHAVMTTQELLTAGLHRKTQRGDRQSAWFLPNYVAPESLHEPQLPIPPYVLGVLLGDGHLPTARISNPSVAVYQRVAELLYTRPSVGRGDRCLTYSLGRSVTHALDGLGIRAHRSADKLIPEAYAASRLSVSQRRELLGGLLDTDGTVNRAGRVVVFSSASAALAGGVAALARSLGGVVSLHRKDVTRYEYKGERRFGRPAFIVNLRMPFNPFIAREERAARWRPQMLARAFASIEPVEPGLSVCIRVSSQENLFFTREYIPTHNTSSAGVAARILSNGGVVLVLGPTYVRSVWRDEMRAIGLCTSEEDFLSVHGREVPEGFWERAKRAKVWFCHYDIVADWMERFRVNPVGKPAVVVLDELHWLRNQKSKRAKAVLSVVATIPRRIGLTGTPVANKPRELWALITIIAGTHAFGSEYSFRQRYCGAVSGGYGLIDQSPTHTEELQARLKDLYMRRTQADAGIVLPPLQRSVVDVELTGGFKHKAADTSDLMRITQALQRGTFGVDTLPVMMRLCQETSLAKLPATLEILHELVEQDEPCVVFVHERKTAEQLAHDLGRGAAFFIHGGMPQLKREELVRAYQDGTAPGVLIATYGALREGVTLHRARNVILHDLTWVPGDILQAEKRVHRIGQKNSVLSRWMTLPGTFDSLLASHLVRKGASIAAAIADMQPAQAFGAAGLDAFAAGTFESEVSRFLSAYGVTHE